MFLPLLGVSHCCLVFQDGFEGSVLLPWVVLLCGWDSYFSDSCDTGTMSGDPALAGMLSAPPHKDRVAFRLRQECILLSSDCYLFSFFF